MLSRHHCKIGFVPASVFTDSNDHNPMVMPDCPSCGGRGKVCRHFTEDGVECHSLSECEACSGKGYLHDARPERLWPEEAEMIEVIRNPNGWVRCPNCGKAFKETGETWSGRRHQCGQKLRIIQE
jgi:hypothetical protein